MDTCTDTIKIRSDYYTVAQIEEFLVSAKYNEREWKLRLALESETKKIARVEAESNLLYNSWLGKYTGIMENAKLENENAKFNMKIQENTFNLELHKHDLTAKLEALCQHLGVKIEKPGNYTVTKLK